MNKLFKCSKKVTAIPDAPNTQILRQDVPHIQYEQIKLGDKFRIYYETAVQSKKVFRMDIQNRTN